LPRKPHHARSSHNPFKTKSTGIVPRPRAPALASTGGLLTIGALSAASGISVETIRTWERRYGFPRAERKPSGHRVYPLETVARLRRVADGLARGHRAAEVVPASEAELDALLGSFPGKPAPHAPVTAASVDPGDWLNAARAFDGERLRRGLGAEWARLGPLEFLEQRAGPFLSSIGDAWADGTLDVRHEHFASAILGDFLRVARQPLEQRSMGPVAALATLPGELHGLGIQMAALVFAQAGWRPLVLGIDTPVAQIAALATEAPLSAVAISCIHRNASGGTGLRSLRALRRKLKPRLPIVVGGSAAGTVRGTKGLDVLGTLTSLDHWLRSRGP
jgi:methanogenic corrinoid protein MtbC1